MRLGGLVDFPHPIHALADFPLDRPHLRRDLSKKDQLFLTADQREEREERFEERAAALEERWDTIAEEVEVHGGKSAKHHFAKLDGDKDGVISEKEMVQGAMRRFDRADADKNGVVTKQERQEARKARKARKHRRHHGHGHHGHHGMKGDVKRDDAQAKAREHFGKIDRNGDGKLTMDELKAAHKRHRGKHGGTHGGKRHGKHDGGSAQ